MTNQLQPYLWPIYPHELLLKSIFYKGNKAITVWRDWQSQVDFNKLDFVSRQMLPLLYRNLNAQQVVDPSLDKYKIFYQQNWIKNHEVFRHVLPVMNLFHEAGVETCLLKGAALSTLCYKDSGSRMMTDCDVLVSQDQVLAAVDILLRQGWQPFSNSQEDFNPRYFAVRHSHGFKHITTNGKLDLHWRVFSECQQRDDLGFRQNSIPLNFMGVATRTLSLTDHLFHTCVHGASGNVGKKIQWVTDAMFIMAAQEDAIDWRHLAGLSKKYQLTLPVYDALRYVSERLQAPVPQLFLQELAGISVKRIIRNEYHYKTNPRAMSFWGTVLRSWHQHSRLTGFRSWGYRLVTYPRYLKLIWGGKSLWRLPVDGFWVITRRFVLDKILNKHRSIKL